MIEQLIPATQPFSELASFQFFTIANKDTELFQRILSVNSFNAIKLTEISVGQRGHDYRMDLVYINSDTPVNRAVVIDIKIKVSQTLS